jgi:hypothetical protein
MAARDDIPIWWDNEIALLRISPDDMPIACQGKL